jgi:hypothetical protein
MSEWNSAEETRAIRGILQGLAFGLAFWGMIALILYLGGLKL